MIPATFQGTIPPVDAAPSKLIVYTYPTAAGWAIGFAHWLVSFALLWAWMVLPISPDRLPLYPLSLIGFSLVWLPGVLLLRQPRWMQQRPERELVPEILQWCYIAAQLLAFVLSLESWLAWLGLPSFLIWAYGVWLLPRPFFFSRRGQADLPELPV